jgi:hypothetical protein
LTRERVSRVIAQIGEEAKVIVRQPDKEAGRRIKYASAHDLRRSCAERLINAGVSAETLMVIMRHKDFATTRRFYGAKRAAQAAAAEIHQKLVLGEKAEELVRDVEQLGQLTAGGDEDLEAAAEIAPPASEGQSGRPLIDVPGRLVADRCTGFADIAPSSHTAPMQKTRICGGISGGN